MARVCEEKVVIKLSVMVKDTDPDPDESILSEEQRSTLIQALEGLIDDSSVMVEL
jgi:hypothetical protein